MRGGAPKLPDDADDFDSEFADDPPLPAFVEDGVGDGDDFALEPSEEDVPVARVDDEATPLEDFEDNIDPPIDPVDDSAGTDLGGPLPVVSWRTTVSLPELGVEIEAYLDPTRPTSEWITTEPARRSSVEATIVIGAIAVRARLRLVFGSEPSLRLGRDVLGGRFLIDARER